MGCGCCVLREKHPEMETILGKLPFICKVFLLHQVWMAMGFNSNSVSREIIVTLKG